MTNPTIAKCTIVFEDSIPTNCVSYSEALLSNCLMGVCLSVLFVSSLDNSFSESDLNFTIFLLNNLPMFSYSFPNVARAVLIKKANKFIPFILTAYTKSSMSVRQEI